VRFGRKLKLAVYQQQETIARRAAGEALAEIARRYNVSHSKGDFVSLCDFLAAKPPGMLPNCDNPAREQQRANDPHQ
jgi:hypothetical protein